MLGYKQTTHVPNEVFDKWLAILTESELKILLVIIRQTYGWIDRYTGRRKLRDRITRTQFMMKAGLSARIVSKTLNSLLKRGLIQISDENLKPLIYSSDRKGKFILLYSINPGNLMAETREQSYPRLGNGSAYNKTNIKLKETKLSSTHFMTNSLKSVGEILIDPRF